MVSNKISDWRWYFLSFSLFLPERRSDYNGNKEDLEKGPYSDSGIEDYATLCCKLSFRGTKAYKTRHRQEVIEINIFRYTIDLTTLCSAPLKQAILYSMARGLHIILLSAMQMS